MNDRVVRVAAIQMDSQDIKTDNLKKAEQLIREAASNGARLTVLPEVFNYSGTHDGVDANSEVLGEGETSKMLSSLARELKIWIHGGSIFEKIPGSSKVYNATMLFDPDGRCAAIYRKMHLFDVNVEDGPSYLESDDVEAGSEIVVCDTEFARLGLSICYDIRFPELFRAMALNGAQILTLCAQFTLNTGVDHWEPLLRARAIEDQCYVIASGQIGVKKAFQSNGCSMIIDPWGTVIARAARKECVVLADIDLDYVSDVRKSVPSLKNRRPDRYVQDVTVLSL